MGQAKIVLPGLVSAHRRDVGANLLFLKYIRRPRLYSEHCRYAVEPIRIIEMGVSIVLLSITERFQAARHRPR